MSVDFSDKENQDIMNAEKQLFEEIKNSLYSTENLSIEKSQKLVFESEQTLTDLKKIFVDKYNQAHCKISFHKKRLKIFKRVSKILPIGK